MSKKRTKSQKAKQAASKASSNASPAMSRRKFIAIPVAVAAIGTAAVGINALEAKSRELHDLEVVGQGQPVIVQIHDPGCPTCRRLKKIVQNSLDGNDDVLFRLADITTTEGKALQTRHAVPHVTLLFYDKKGRHVHTTRGLQTTESVQAAVEQVF